MSAANSRSDWLERGPKVMWSLIAVPLGFNSPGGRKKKRTIDVIVQYIQ